MGTIQRSFGELSLVERLKAKKNNSCLILDTSGSMSEPSEPGISRIEALRNIVKGLETNPDMYWFNNDCGKCTKDTIPKPSGNTVLSSALAIVKKAGHSKAVIITDGNINSFDQQKALEEAKDMQLHILYVGPDDSKPAFLDLLAKKTGGFCNKEDLKFTRELGEKITKLLGNSNTGDSSIQL